MGLFSNIFTKGNTVTASIGFKASKPKIVSGRSPGKGWVAANRFNKARGGFAGGWAAIAFGNIINAHSSAEDIVDEFGLDQEDAPYGNCYQMAYREARQDAIVEMMLAMDFFGDPEDYIDWSYVEDIRFKHSVYMCIKQLQSEWFEGIQITLEPFFVRI